MSSFLNLSFAFIFSFVGSIPPGTLNLSVIQLGLSERMKAALRFCLAAAIIEYPYAWIAVKFESLITSSPVILNNLQLIAAAVMTLLGVINLWPTSKRPSELYERFKKSGFRRGILLSLLNPLVIPYWIGITAYLRSRGWIELSTPEHLHSYLIGISLGAFALLAVLAYLAKRIAAGFLQATWLKKIPGTILLILGFYGFADYFLAS